MTWHLAILLTIWLICDVAVFWAVNSYVASLTDYYFSNRDHYVRIWFNWEEFREYTTSSTLTEALIVGLLTPISIFMVIEMFVWWSERGYHKPKTEPKRIFAKR